MLKKFNHIEMYVSNIYQAAFFYKTALSFLSHGSSKMIDGSQKENKHFLTHQDINLVLTSAVHHENNIVQHVMYRGDSIKDIAFHVHDAEVLFNHAVNNGARAIAEPVYWVSEGKTWCQAKIGTLGEVIHSLISCPDEDLAPSLANLHLFEPAESNAKKTILFNAIDHVAICVHAGELNQWIDFYSRVFGLKESHNETIDTGKSGMNSKVVVSENNAIKIVFTEPLMKYKKSQIQEFINYNHGPGVQHVAFTTDDIVGAVKTLVDRGITFLNVPGEYYKQRKEILPEAAEKITLFEKLNILIDKDKDGYLYQVFSHPIETRPTFFFEIIQREGCRGFGNNNIKALFNAIEAEQKKRGAI